MLEQLVARLVDIGRRGVVLEIPRPDNLAREVVPRVEELEEASDGVEIFVDEVDAPVLRGWVSGGVMKGRRGGKLTATSLLNLAQVSTNHGLWARRAS